MDIRSLPPEALTAQLTAWGYPAFRAKQIRQWLDRGVTDFGEMSNLPSALRQQLAEQYTVPGVEIRRKLVSAIDGTVKYLFAPDHRFVAGVPSAYPPADRHLPKWYKHRIAAAPALPVQSATVPETARNKYAFRAVRLLPNDKSPVQTQYPAVS